MDSKTLREMLLVALIVTIVGAALSFAQVTVTDLADTNITTLLAELRTLPKCAPPLWVHEPLPNYYDSPLAVEAARVCGSVTVSLRWTSAAILKHSLEIADRNDLQIGVAYQPWLYTYDRDFDSTRQPPDSHPDKGFEEIANVYQWCKRITDAIPPERITTVMLDSETFPRVNPTARSDAALLAKHEQLESLFRAMFGDDVTITYYRAMNDEYLLPPGLPLSVACPRLYEPQNSDEQRAWLYRVAGRAEALGVKRVRPYISLGYGYAGAPKRWQAVTLPDSSYGELGRTLRFCPNYDGAILYPTPDQPAPDGAWREFVALVRGLEVTP